VEMQREDNTWENNQQNNERYYCKYQIIFSYLCESVESVAKKRNWEIVKV
jgi:hypothetical protein